MLVKGCFLCHCCLIGGQALKIEASRVITINCFKNKIVTLCKVNG